MHYAGLSLRVNPRLNQWTHLICLFMPVCLYAGEVILYTSPRIATHDDQGSAPRRLTYEEAVEEAGMYVGLCWKHLFLISHPLFGLCMLFFFYI